MGPARHGTARHGTVAPTIPTIIANTPTLDTRYPDEGSLSRLGIHISFRISDTPRTQVSDNALPLASRLTNSPTYYDCAAASSPESIQFSNNFYSSIHPSIFEKTRFSARTSNVSTVAQFLYERCSFVISPVQALYSIVHHSKRFVLLYTVEAFETKHEMTFDPTLTTDTDENR